MDTNTDNHEKFNGWRTQPIYTISEAAQLAHVHPNTVRNWLRSYSGAKEGSQPSFTARDRDRAMVSFLQLIEIVVAGQFRKALRVKFQTVRSAYENAREIVGSQYPFAHARLEPLGGRIVHTIQDQPPEASIREVARLKEWPPLPNEVLETIHQLDYLQELASKWFPLGREVPIVIDPQISTGIPTVVGTGITVGAIHERFKAGHRIEFLARDYELEPTIVQTVIQYAMRHSELVAA